MLMYYQAGSRRSNLTVLSRLKRVMACCNLSPRHGANHEAAVMADRLRDQSSSGRAARSPQGVTAAAALVPTCVSSAAGDCYPLCVQRYEGMRLVQLESYGKHVNTRQCAIRHTCQIDWTCSVSSGTNGTANRRCVNAPLCVAGSPKVKDVTVKNGHSACRTGC